MGKSTKSSLLGNEDARVVQRAVEAALVAVLQEQQPQKKPKNKTTKPLSPASTVKRVAKATARATKSYKQSSKHGFRGVPPPLDFSLAELRDDQLLTEFEVAALTRLSTSTFEAWRKRADHPLRWMKITGGRVRYRAGDVQDFIASGYRPRLGRPRKKDPTPTPAGTFAATTTQNVAPQRRRPPRRPRAAEAAPQDEAAR